MYYNKNRQGLTDYGSPRKVKEVTVNFAGSSGYFLFLFMLVMVFDKFNYQTGNRYYHCYSWEYISVCKHKYRSPFVKLRGHIRSCPPCKNLGTTAIRKVSALQLIFYSNSHIMSRNLFINYRRLLSGGSFL